MLDERSQEFADALFLRFPEWRKGSSVRHWQGKAYLHVDIARPVSDDPVGGLAISTENGEITIEYGRHGHSHFRLPSSGPPLSDEVLAFLAEIFNEERVFARFERGGSVLGGRTLDAAEARTLLENGPPPELVTPRFRIAVDTVSLWSWRGTFDGTVKR